MRMIRSEAKVPYGEIGPSNKHGPPVWPPPILRLRIRGKPRTRDPVVGRVPDRNKAPASHLQLVLVIRPPSLLWESYVRPPTESQQANLLLRGNNYWDRDRPPDNCVCHSRHRIQSTEPGMGELCAKAQQAVETLTGLKTLSSLKTANVKRSIYQHTRISTDQNKRLTMFAK